MCCHVARERGDCGCTDRSFRHKTTPEVCRGVALCTKSMYSRRKAAQLTLSSCVQAMRGHVSGPGERDSHAPQTGAIPFVAQFFSHLPNGGVPALLRCAPSEARRYSRSRWFTRGCASSSTRSRRGLVHLLCCAGDCRDANDECGGLVASSSICWTAPPGCSENRRAGSLRSSSSMSPHRLQRSTQLQLSHPLSVHTQSTPSGTW